MQQIPEHVAKILEKRYLLRDAQNIVIESPQGMFRRVAACVSLGNKDKEEEFYQLMSSLDFLPNSPTLMNSRSDGVAAGTLSACFVIPINDSLVDGEDSIMQSAISWAAVQKFGGGVGASFSRLRRRGAHIKSTHGVSCGSVAVIKHYSSITDMVTQGGKRHGANMGVLRVDHPDIMDFIRCKDTDKEIRNFNISVGITDAFMKAVKDDKHYDLIEPSTGEVISSLRARSVFDIIVKQAHKNGEPGLIFIDKMNKYNPTPEVGSYEATNPCFAGGMRLATNKGLLTFNELYKSQIDISVTTDKRIYVNKIKQVNGDDIENISILDSKGTVLRKAVPVFKTRKNYPVYKLETKHGLEVVVTDDHKFFTPNGKVPLKDLKVGDVVLIQSGSGVWNDNYDLPEFKPTNKYAARVKRGEAHPPKKWSREIGELLGWVMGDGWISSEIPKGRKVPNYTVGMCFNTEDQITIMSKIDKMVKEWTGLDGFKVTRKGDVRNLMYKSALYYFINSLGVGLCTSLTKRVPKSLWSAPREAVVGFLSAMFSADGTVNVSSDNKKSCSIRLSSSSLNMLKDIQILLLNEGIYSSLNKRREAGIKLMPDSKGNLKEYNTAEQYELILDAESRDRFINNIGFMNNDKSNKYQSWFDKKKKKSDKHDFVDTVLKIEYLGNEDVYCTTEPETHSIIVNGLVTAQCGEQPLLPYESCNLGSINLLNMVDVSEEQPQVNWDKLEKTVNLAVEFLDNIIDINKFPLPQIEQATKANRKIGLGVMGFADMLIALGIPYNSNEAVRKAEDIMRFIDEKSKETSIKLAEVKGSFPNFDKSIYKKDKRYKKGLRNATTTTIAPTGTIGLIADVSQGIEPIFMVAQKRRMGDVINAEEVKEGKSAKYYNFNIINRLFEKAAKKVGIYNDEMLEKIYGVNSIQNVVGIPQDIKKIFRTAYDISPEWHIKMQAAFQKYVDNAVSKCVAKGTLISTNQGIMPIEKLGDAKGSDVFGKSLNDLCVIDDNGDIKKVISHYSGGIKSTLKIRLNDGKTYEMTHNHKIMTLDGWCKASDLKVGDIVMGRCGGFVENLGGQVIDVDMDSDGFKMRTNANCVNIPKNMSADLAKILGMIVADGHTEVKTGLVGLYEKNENVGKVYDDLCYKLFGVMPKVFVDKRNGVVGHTITSRILVRWVQQLIGMKSGDKHIPCQIMQGSIEEQIAFMEGVTLDGYLIERGETEIKHYYLMLYMGKSKILADQLFSIANNLNLRPYYCTKKVDGYDYSVYGVEVGSGVIPIESHKRCDDIRIRQRLVILPDCVYNMILSVKNPEYSNLRYIKKCHPKYVWDYVLDKLGVEYDKNTYLLKVTNIDESQNEVYDIEVEDSHSYLLDGIISHNTCNLPESATESDVYKAYWLAYDSDCKGITVYRDNSRSEQVVTKVTSDKEEVEDNVEEVFKMVRPTPERAYGYRDKIETGCGSLYVSLHEDDQGLCEVFVAMGQAGGCTSCWSNSLGKVLSISLRSGVSPKHLMKQLRGNKCPRIGGKIGSRVLSCPDGIGIVLMNYLVEKGVMDKANIEEIQKINQELAQNDVEIQMLGKAVNGYKHIGQCPECGSSSFDQTSKCPLCMICGWTECS